MTSRVQLIREAYGQTPEEFAKVLDIHREWLFMAENTLDSSDIPDHIIEKIHLKYNLSKEFILGYPFTVRKPVQSWHPDERRDYMLANKKLQIILTAQFGYCEYDLQTQSSGNT